MGDYIYIDTHLPFICSAHVYTQMFNGERQRFNLGDGIEVFSILQFTAEDNECVYYQQYCTLCGLILVIVLCTS